MSTERRPIPTYVLVCDLCGDPIPEKDSRYVEGTRGNVIVGVTPMETVTNKTRHALLCWGHGTRRKTPKPDGPPIKNYDFHGECIAKLVDDAVQARHAREQCVTALGDAPAPRVPTDVSRPGGGGGGMTSWGPGGPEPFTLPTSKTRKARS